MYLFPCSYKGKCAKMYQGENIKKPFSFGRVFVYLFKVGFVTNLYELPPLSEDFGLMLSHKLKFMVKYCYLTICYYGLILTLFVKNKFHSYHLLCLEVHTLHHKAFYTWRYLHNHDQTSLSLSFELCPNS